MWQPIETAPKDNKRPLWLARFNDDGTMQSFDYNGSWESDYESWEMPEVYYYWASENGNGEEPSHWAYQPEGFCTLPGAQPAPGISEGWLRAIDEALVVAHIGVANESDTFEQAREKLDNLIGFHVDVASDPAVNGGWKLVPIEPTHETLMEIVGAIAAPVSFREVRAIYAAMLAVAPEAKP